MNTIRHPTKKRSLVLVLSASAFVISLPRVSHAEFLPVYGGLTHSSSTGGYIANPPINPLSSDTVIRVNDAGTAIGTARRYDATGTFQGWRAIRWDSSGAVELGNFWTGGDVYVTSFTTAINATGTIVGFADQFDGPGPYPHVGPRAARWDDPDAVPLELGDLGTTPGGFSQTLAFAINDAGTSVGNAFKYDASGDYLGYSAVRWDGSGTAPTELGVLGTPDGPIVSEAFAINDAGTAVGTAAKYNASGNRFGERAVRWNAGGTAATELGHLGTDILGTTFSAAWAINAAGTAVGQAQKFNINGDLEGLGYRAVRWDASGTQATELGNLGTNVNGFTTTIPFDISDSGTTVGSSRKYDASGTYQGSRAVRWSALDTAATELGNLGTDTNGFSMSRAHAVNAADISVGYAATFDSSGNFLGDHAVYWGANGAAVDLNTLIDPDSGWLLGAAYDISDTGWIAGAGPFDPDGPGGEDAYLRHFLIHVPATAVPEPASMLLLSTGAIVIGLFVARRRRHWCIYLHTKKMRAVTISLSVAVLWTCSSRVASADIFKWEYINPTDPSQGKQQSTTLVTDGAGAHAVPGADLSHRDLTMAYLIGADLSFSEICGEDWCITDPADLTGTTLAQADLTNASFYFANLTGANLTGAEVRGANFERGEYGSGITPAQLYSTASYQAHDLAGIGLSGSNFAGGNLAGQNLTNANINYATLTGANLSQANLTNANFNWTTLSGANLTGAEVRGANFTRYHAGGITLAQLYSTASYQAHDLTGIQLNSNDLTGGNLAGQNLTNANFGGATLSGANLTGAEVRGANFFGGHFYNGSGLTLTQLYSTASYQAHDLIGIGLGGNDLTGANLVGQNLTNATFFDTTLNNADLSQANLTNAYFAYAKLTGANLSEANLTNARFWCCANLTNANLSGADARGADFEYATLTGTNTSNLIHPDGHIAGLNLTAGKSLVVRDYDGNPAAYPTPTGLLPIVVDQSLAMDATGTLRLVFDADPWDSTISFAPGIPVARGGTLELTFAPDVNIATQSGRTIDLFDWTGVTPTGAFTVASPYTWDLSNLYTTGEVTFASLPVIPGDYNNNGVVDAADYTVWRDNLGSTTALPNDNTPGVGPDDYTRWKTNFGQTAGSGAGAIVPEPRSLMILLLSGALPVWTTRRRRR